MLLTFEQAKQNLLNEALTFESLETETISLANAHNRITAEPIISPINVPSFDNSAMDGYAIRIADLEKSTLLPQAGVIYAGDAIDNLFWPEGTCLRIMTGAIVPNEADCVVMQEQTEKSSTGIAFTHPVTKGQNIRRIGEDIKQGAIALEQGRKLTISALSSLATLGISQVNVFKKLKVALFSTGNELTQLGSPLANSSAIYDSNRFSLGLLLKSLNCEVIDLGIISDDPELIKNALNEASTSADLIITSGGVSVGDADYTKTALEQLGKINFWKIAMKPGKPFAFGRLGRSLFCGLPGNPVSTLVTFYQLVQPLILALSGCKTENSLTFKVKSTTNLKKTIGRIDFQRGVLHKDSQGELVVKATGMQGSHLTRSFNEANCFIILDAEQGDVSQGELVRVELFNDLLK